MLSNDPMIGRRGNSAGKRGITVPKIKTIVKLEGGSEEKLGFGGIGRAHV